MPYAVYFRILSVLPGGDWAPRTVMKSYKDLKDLHVALEKELPSAWLPGFPTPQPRMELTDSAFRFRLGDYLACLAGNNEVVEAYSVKEFFHFTHEYRGSPTSRRLRESSPCFRPQLETVNEPDAPPARSAPVVPLNRPGTSRNLGDSDGFQLTSASLDVTRAHTSPMIQTPGTSIWATEYYTMETASEADSTHHSVPSPDRLNNSIPTSAEDSIRSWMSEQTSGGSSVDYSENEKGSRRRRRRRPSCVVCLAKPQETAIDPCGHICMCQACTSAVKECPVCRGPINKALRVFVA